jgi:ribonuclease D
VSRTALQDRPVLWVDRVDQLEELVDEACQSPSYAVDTEFHRERTYYPQLALVQVCVGERIWLVDPLAVDLTPMARLLKGTGVAVMHAASQDLEVLHQACGTVPSRLFDTQLAAGFLGWSSPSLSSLCERALSEHVPKGDRLTDWLQRPLGEAQRSYAAADVALLPRLHDHLLARLQALGRLEWAESEFEVLRSKAREDSDPEDAWQRIKEARHLPARAGAVAKELAAWRERTARATDQPVRFVLGDLALVSIAQQRPATLDALKKVRGLDGRALRDGAGHDILAAVQRGAEQPTGVATRIDGGQAELERELRPAVTLVSAWVSQLARNEQLDPALLATRADIVAFLRGDADARLSQGWRHDLVGAPIRALVEGRAALAFEGRGRLVLEPRATPDRPG